MGVGRKDAGDLVDHVLGEYGAVDRELMDASASRAADAVESWLVHGVERTMNTFNGNSEDGEA